MYQGLPTINRLLKPTISNREKENIELTDKIIEIHEASRRRYGAPKIHVLLERAGYTVGIKRIQRLMREAGIRSIVVKNFRPSSSKETVVERDNLLERDFSTDTINEKWVSDITYINTLSDG